MQIQRLLFIVYANRDRAVLVWAEPMSATSLLELKVTETDKPDTIELRFGDSAKPLSLKIPDMASFLGFILNDRVAAIIGGDLLRRPLTLQAHEVAI